VPVEPSAESDESYPGPGRPERHAPEEADSLSGQSLHDPPPSLLLQVLFCANSSGDIISVLAASAESAITERKDFEHRDSPYVAMQRHKKAFVGVLCVFNIRDKDNRIRNPERSFFSDEVQTTKAEIEEKANQLRTVQAERADFEMTFKMKKEMIESTHKSKEARIREEAKREKDKNRILNENRKKEKDEAEMNNTSTSLKAKRIMELG
jgi:hypothetical protein